MFKIDKFKRKFKKTVSDLMSKFCVEEHEIPQIVQFNEEVDIFVEIENSKDSKNFIRIDIMKLPILNILSSQRHCFQSE